MIKLFALRLLVVGILFGWLVGCASQPQKSEEAAAKMTPSASETQAPQPIEEDSSSQLTAEEEALFDDDTDEWETEKDQEVVLVSDPIEPFNRAMFTFNEKFYDWLLRPVSLGYRKVTPKTVRVGVENFFTNLATPVRFTNCLLQGKGQAATAELSKFMFNSTFGVLGFGDLFKDYPEMYPDSEDFGQTLGSYGAGEGFYVIWPFLGHSTLRDTIGLAGDFALTPTSYLDRRDTSLAVYAIEKVNKVSFRIEEIDDARKAAFDPYEALRNYHIQSRRSKIKK